MGIYNCQADFHPFFYLSLYFTIHIFAPIFFFLLFFFFFHCMELRFYHLIILKKAISIEENFLYPKKRKDSKFTAIFGVFPTRPMKKEEEAKLFLQINLCLCIIINYFTSTAIRKTFQKSTGIFQSVQDYFFFSLALFYLCHCVPFVFVLLQLCGRERKPQ